MLQSNGLKGRISAKESITAKLNNKEVQVYPELEDLIVTPSGQEQHFKSDKYGFNEVTVQKVESEELNIVPSVEEQVKEGLFNKVTISGDSDLVPENIKQGTEIFGVKGNAKTANMKITDASYLFYKMARLDYVNDFLRLCDKVTNMAYMFNGCSKLTSLDLSNFDASKVVNLSGIFNSCSNLTNLKCFKNLGKGYTQKSNNYSNYRLTLSNTGELTHESLMSVINNLYDLNLSYDVANGGTLYRQGLLLGSTNLAKLTEEEIAIATSKGWNVS